VTVDNSLITEASQKSVIQQAADRVARDHASKLDDVILGVLSDHTGKTIGEITQMVIDDHSWLRITEMPDGLEILSVNGTAVLEFHPSKVDIQDMHIRITQNYRRLEEK